MAETCTWVTRFGPAGIAPQGHEPLGAATEIDATAVAAAGAAQGSYGSWVVAVAGVQIKAAPMVMYRACEEDAARIRFEQLAEATRLKGVMRDLIRSPRSPFSEISAAEARGEVHFGMPQLWNKNLRRLRRWGGGKVTVHLVDETEAEGLLAYTRGFAVVLWKEAGGRVVIPVDRIERISLQ